MKSRIYSLLIVLVSVLVVSSCGESDTPSPGNDKAVNEWILAQMADNYYWQAELPANPNMLADSKAFFNSLKNGNDKYSEIKNKSESSTDPGVELGFEYAANKYNDGKVYYVILYTKPGTSAERNLERGYVISHVNGTLVTEANAQKLMVTEAKKSSTLKLTGVRLDLTPFPIELTTTTTAYNENPLYFSDVYTNNNQEKAGYIVYNMFKAGNSASPNAYNQELMNKLSQFASDPALKYLIVDLRYNGGGVAESAAYLASAIVNARNTGNNFIVYHRNPKLGTGYTKFRDKVDNTNINIPKLGDQLKKVYVLTGKYTAATSETFIHCLRAYMGSKMEVIGLNTTAGRNYMIRSYSPQNGSTNPYILNLFYAYLGNKDGDTNYGSGIRVDVPFDEIGQSTSIRLLALGDMKEALLKTTLERITGVSPKMVRSDDQPGIHLGSSLELKPWYNQITSDGSVLDN